MAGPENHSSKVAGLPSALLYKGFTKCPRTSPFYFLQKNSFVREFFKKQICFRLILQNKFKNENSSFVPHVIMECISLPLNLKSMKFFNEKESFTLKDFVERIF